MLYPQTADTHPIDYHAPAGAFSDSMPCRQYRALNSFGTIVLVCLAWAIAREEVATQLCLFVIGVMAISHSVSTIFALVFYWREGCRIFEGAIWLLLLAFGIFSVCDRLMTIYF